MEFFYNKRSISLYEEDVLLGILKSKNNLFSDGFESDGIRFNYDQKEMCIKVTEIANYGYDYECGYSCGDDVLAHEIHLKQIKSSSDLLKILAFFERNYGYRNTIALFLDAFYFVCCDCFGRNYTYFLYNDKPFPFDEPGRIYLIKAIGTQRLKIGFSNDPKKRIHTISTSSPYPLSIVKTFIGDQSEEKELHAQFAKYRVNGEWFEIAGDLEKWIKYDFLGL